MSQVIAEEVNPRFYPNICVLSGPNLSLEIAQKLPAATVIAAADNEIKQYVTERVNRPRQNHL